MIRKVGREINYDFSNDLHQDLRFKAPLLTEVANREFQHSDAPDSIYYWMEKYVSLLEDYKRLLKILENHDAVGQYKFNN